MSGPPRIPEANPVLRESFLSRWRGSEYGRTLRRYGELLHVMSAEAESMLLRRERCPASGPCSPPRARSPPR